jgi:preprotein translocase subunit SecA
MIRTDYPDVIYRTQKEKYNAIVEEICQMYEKGRPCLIGTISIENSERLSNMLKKRGIPHQVLNAKYHEMEAQIIALAGQKKAVTVATNMAGRGTDIVLGEGVAELGGLHIIGTERHEARRIDNQLRGRAGRQGDKGSSRFYLSLEDDLMRIFGSEKISSMMEKLGLQEDEVIEHPWITKAIERAQRQVEAHNFDIRKRLLEYDDVMNKQRNIIYVERNRILEEEDLSEHVQEIMEDVIQDLIDTHAPPKSYPDEWNIDGLNTQLFQIFGITLPSLDGYKDVSELHEAVLDKVKQVHHERTEQIGKNNMNELCRGIMLHVLDSLWKDHLHNMDYLKEGINLRAYGQKDPLIEYKHEGFAMFDALITRMKEEMMEYIFKMQLIGEDAPIQYGQMFAAQDQSANMQFQDANITPATTAPAVTTTRHKKKRKKGTVAAIGTSVGQNVKRKIGRNDPCPCGSGKKYKKCHGKS